MAGRIAGAFDLPVTWFRQEPGPMPIGGADPANPILAAEMKSFMSDESFKLGVAWDGDCDRCVCFDAAGDVRAVVEGLRGLDRRRVAENLGHALGLLEVLGPVGVLPGRPGRLARRRLRRL